MSKVTITGIGSVLVDITAGTLQPSSHVVGQRLGVGYSFDSARKMEIARQRTHEVQVAATEQFGQPEFGWQWIDHNGAPTNA